MNARSSSNPARRDARADAVRGILHRAAEWRLLGLLLERPRPGWSEELEAVAANVADAELRAVAREARDAGQGDYLRILGPGGWVSPREVSHRPFADPGRLLAEVAGTYSAFAYHAVVEDPPDHVAVEAGFVSYLALKEAYALARDDRDHLATTRAAVREFLATHLAPLAAGLRRSLAPLPAGYLSKAAALLGARCPAPSTGGASLHVIRPADPVEEGFGCGAAGRPPSCAGPDGATD